MHCYCLIAAKICSSSEQIVRWSCYVCQTYTKGYYSLAYWDLHLKPSIDYYREICARWIEHKEVSPLAEGTSNHMLQQFMCNQLYSGVIIVQCWDCTLNKASAMLSSALWKKWIVHGKVPQHYKCLTWLQAVELDNANLVQSGASDTFECLLKMKDKIQDLSNVSSYFLDATHFWMPKLKL